MSECTVVDCDGGDWKEGYCWIHHQAWLRYLENLSYETEAEPHPPIVFIRYEQEVQWHVKGELWVDMGTAGVDFIQVNTMVLGRSRVEALRKAKQEVTKRPRARWDYDTVECVAIQEAA